MPACKHVALGVEMGSSTSHSLGDMGLEGQGCQIKASDPLPWVQGEGTAGGCLEASEEAVTGHAHRYSLTGAFLGQTASLLLLVPSRFRCPFSVLPFPCLSLWVWTDGGHGLLMLVFSHRSKEEEASPTQRPGERWRAVAVMHRGIASSGHPRCRP